MVTGLLQKRKLAKKNKRENNKTYQKNPACTHANPYLQQA